MDELVEKPLNQAHVKMRKATAAYEAGNLLYAIEFYRNANENLRTVLETLGDDTTNIIKRSVEHQISDNDWKIRSLQLKDLAEFKKALGDDADEEAVVSRSAVNQEEDDEDDGVVLISNEHLNFYMDSLCPDATIIRLNMHKQDRLADIPFNNTNNIFGRNNSGKLHRSPSLPENTYSFGRRLAKTEEERRQEQLLLHAHENM